MSRRRAGGPFLLGAGAAGGALLLFLVLPLVSLAGATGLIGTVLVDRLRSRGHTVRRLLRSSRGAGADDVVWDPFCGAGAELVEVACRPSALLEVVDRAVVAVHGSAEEKPEGAALSVAAAVGEPALILVLSQ